MRFVNILAAFFCFAAFVPLLFITLSFPIIPSIAFFSSTVNGETKQFGTFGYTGSGRVFRYNPILAILGTIPEDLEESAFQRWYFNSPRLGPPIIALVVFLLGLWILLSEVILPKVGKTTTTALTGVGLFVTTGTCTSSLVKWQTVRRYIVQHGPPGSTAELGNTHCTSP
ncbi:hypothetical protein CPB86DRAFT_97763 [Serendipita vermifera]|nr:hypothetical protein CPB86DRAFT_97763 [Serendipita vermifera]